MDEANGRKMKVFRGLIGALLTFGLGAVALKGRLSPLVLGLGLGIFGAFVAAYLESAMRNGMLGNSKVYRAIALIFLPPLGSLLALLWDRDFALGFTFSSLASWALVYGLRGLWEAPALRGGH